MSNGRTEKERSKFSYDLSMTVRNYQGKIYYNMMKISTVNTFYATNLPSPGIE